MKKNHCPLLVALVLTLTSSLLQAQTKMDRQILLSGKDWEFREGPVPADQKVPDDLRTGEWMRAEVPGNVQADLEDRGKLGAWTYGATDPRVYQPEKQNWWYKKAFTVPQTLQDRRLNLVFDGVDHQCDVWLNGEFLGSHSGMFRKFSFEIGNKIRFGAPNELLVFIHRIPASITDGGPWITKVWTGLKDLKSLTSNAWDWTPTALWSMGIWKDVRIEATGPARVEWVLVTTKLSDGFTKAAVSTNLEIHSLAAVAAKAEFRIEGHGADAQATKSVELKIGENNVAAELALPNPKLWWPNGQGEQPLYKLVSKLTDVNGKVLDQRETTFGVREITWEHCEGVAEDFPVKNRMIMNGRPTLIYGPNITPTDMFFGRAHRPDNNRIRRLLRLARDSGMNALRLWGGGVVFSDELYDLADQYGIMLSMEVPLSAYVPEPDPVFLKNLDATTRQIVKSLRNHPSIIEWSGGNEVPWGGQNAQQPALQVIRTAVQELDERNFIATCPVEGGFHSPYFYRPDNSTPVAPIFYRWPQSYEHYNAMKTLALPGTGFVGGLDIQRYGEFGVPTPANLETWQREVSPQSAFPATDATDPALQVHRAAKAFLDDSIWLSRPVIVYLFGEPKNLEEMVKGGQFIGAEGLRYAYDAGRRMGPKMGVLFSWHYTEPWPNLAGNFMVDFNGKPLMNFDFLRSAFAPVTIGLRQDYLLYDPTKPIQVSVRVQNDSGVQQEHLQWSWKARDRRGKVFAENKGKITAAHQASAVAEDLNLTPPRETALGPIFIELALSDAGGRVLTERVHVLSSNWTRAPLRGLLDATLADPDDVTDLNIPPVIQKPTDAENLALSSSGKVSVTATSTLAGYEPVVQEGGAVGLMPDGGPQAKVSHGPEKLIDGVFGNDSSWIPDGPDSSFKVDLGLAQEIASFRLGRDRVGTFVDRLLGGLKIEVSKDTSNWQTVYEVESAAALPGYAPGTTMDVEIAPVSARHIRVTVNPATPGLMPAIDEFEVRGPRAQPSSSQTLPLVVFGDSKSKLQPRSVTQTKVEAAIINHSADDKEEVLTLRLTNAGSMTALFSSIHPLLDHQVDFYLSSNHISIPPGESREVTVRAPKVTTGNAELTLAQTGWQIATWNAPEVIVEPDSTVLFAAGRRDRMNREFGDTNATGLATRLADPAGIRRLMEGGSGLELTVNANNSNAAALRLHTSDQSPSGASVVGTINGREITVEVPAGEGVQKATPEHLALAKTVVLQIPAGALRPGDNQLKLAVKGEGWFTWDAIHLVSEGE